MSRIITEPWEFERLGAFWSEPEFENAFYRYDDTGQPDGFKRMEIIVREAPIDIQTDN